MGMCQLRQVGYDLSQWSYVSADLIIVRTATTGGGVPFRSWRTFSTENAKWTVLRKVYSENENTEYTKENTKYAKQNTQYAKQNIKYAKQNKYAISIKRVRKKNKICQKLI